MKFNYKFLFLILLFSTVSVFAQNNFSIKFKHFSNGEITKKDTIRADFTITNLGPKTYQPGDKIYASNRINGRYFGHDLFGTFMEITLTQPMGIGDTVDKTTGYILGSQSMSFLTMPALGFIGDPTKLKMQAYVWGDSTDAIGLPTLNQNTIVNSETSFPQDTDPLDNIATFTFDPNYDEKTDLVAQLTNYTNGQTITQDLINGEFKITNNGPYTFDAGQTIFVSAKINGQYFGLDLNGTQTAVTLTHNLRIGDTFTFNPGNIIPTQTLPLFPGATTLDFCIVVWGNGTNAVDLANSTFPKDLNGADNLSCVQYDGGSLGTNENNFAKSSVSVYPNPTTDEVNFRFNDENSAKNIAIYDASGKLVSSAASVKGGTYKMNVQNLKSGLYLYKVSSEKGKTETGKIIKK